MARSLAFLASASYRLQPYFGDRRLPALNMSKGVDQTAHMLLAGTTLLFVGKIEKQRFVGNISRIQDVVSDAAVDITYRVEKVFKGHAGPEITLRTPFFCEACSIANARELKEALDGDLGQQLIVFVYDDVDQDGHRRRVVSGGCPASIDANVNGDLVAALAKVSSAGR